MARDRDPNDTPAWMLLVIQPGVMATMAALYNHGPAAFDALRAYVEIDGRGRRTAAAIRRLAAWQMCRRSGASGSWDEPVHPSNPEIIYELTDYGHRFAQVMDDLQKVVAGRIPPGLRRTRRRRR
jgi:DNA-binding HxlR family transcriptional regulator